MASAFISRNILFWSYQWKKLLPSRKMLNLPEIPVNSFIGRNALSWWSKEAEWLTARLDKWLATYRGYTKLRTSRISRACRTMVQESDEDSSSGDDGSNNFEPIYKSSNRRCYSQPSSPDHLQKSQTYPQECLDNNINIVNFTNPVDAENNEIKEPEACDVKVIEEDYKRQFRQPYGWTDYTKDCIIEDQNGNKATTKQTETAKITRQNSNECCNSCCYEFCCEAKTTTPTCAAHGNDNDRKKRGPLEAITNKISQANRKCDKYFSFRRRYQVHVAQEESFFTHRRRRSTYKKTSRIRNKKRVVCGGTTDNDPMWPAVLLTFDRGVTLSQPMALTLITSMPETVL